MYRPVADPGIRGALLMAELMRCRSWSSMNAYRSQASLFHLPMSLTYHAGANWRAAEAPPCLNEWDFMRDVSMFHSLSSETVRE